MTSYLMWGIMTVTSTNRKYPMPLTAIFVRTIKPLHRVHRYSDKHGLLLAVQRTGSKQWIQRIVIAGKRCDLGLGSYPYISLAEARERAIINKADVMRGRDPRKPKAPRFDQLVDDFVKIHSPHWRPNTAQGKRTHLKALTPLYRAHVNGISPDDCLRILRPLYQRGSTTAKPIRTLLRTILNLAVSQGIINSNPAGEGLDAALPPFKRKVKHHTALPPSDAPAAYQKLTGSRSPGALALQFVMLTATRPNEVKAMRWDEVSNDTWSIPHHRMKAGTAHTVPLTQPALDILRHAREANPHTTHVFPTRKDTPLYQTAMAHYMKKYQIAGTVHGMRSTFADWAISQGYPRDLVELSLAHAVGSQTARAYARDTLLEKRRALMDAWSDYITDKR